MSTPRTPWAKGGEDWGPDILLPLRPLTSVPEKGPDRAKHIP
jgi:hypothetical protein